MYLLGLSVLILALKLLEVRWFGALSWWWISVPFVLTFIWFEFIERHLGLEKKKAMDEMDAAKKARIKRALEVKTPGKRG